MKKVFKILGSLASLMLIAILTIPFFINVDKFRPQIVKAASEQLNGSLELGQLKLSLWGKVHVGVDGLKILDSSKKEVVSVKDASFDMPYMSVLSGSPLITLVMKQPMIRVLKDKDGKLNVLSLMKSAPTSAAAPQSHSAPVNQIELPAMAVNAHFGIYVEDATLVYQDQAKALTNTVDKLNLRVKDFSLSRKTELELWADLKTKMGTDLTVEGPLKLNAELKPEISGGEFKSASVDASFSADDLMMEKGALFIKKKGVPTHFKFNASLDQNSLKLKEAVLQFHNAEVEVSGSFNKDTGADFKFNTKPVDLKSWSELIPMLKEYELEGKLGLQGEVKGKVEAINYAAKMTVENLSAKGPNLKAKPVINGLVQVATDRIEKFAFDLKGPGNEMLLEGKLISFTKPQVSFSFTSPKGMDLDQWIEFPKPEIAAKGAGGSKASPESKGAVAADFDAMLDPLRSNEMLKDMSVDGVIGLSFVKAKGFKIEDIAAKFQMKNLILALTGVRMKMFEGLMTGSFSTDLKPKAPLYNMSFALSGLDMSKAVESQFTSFKDTLSGKVSASIQGGGASFNSDTAKQKLQMKGDFKIVNAAFASMDIAKIANEAINGALAKIADKIPLLKGKSLRVKSNGESKYDLISSNFTINQGVLDAPNFVAKAATKRGVDLKGATKMGILDQSIDAKWELIDAQRVTGADQLSVEIAGKTISNFLAKSEKDPVILPITVGCKWSAPCVSYTQVPEYLAGVVAGRLSHVAQDTVKEKVKDAVKGALQQGVGNALKGLFGH